MSPILPEDQQNKDDFLSYIIIYPTRVSCSLLFLPTCQSAIISPISHTTADRAGSHLLLSDVIALPSVGDIQLRHWLTFHPYSSYHTISLLILKRRQDHTTPPRLSPLSHPTPLSYLLPFTLDSFSSVQQTPLFNLIPALSPHPTPIPSPLSSNPFSHHQRHRAENDGLRSDVTLNNLFSLPDGVLLLLLLRRTPARRIRL